MTMTDYKPSAKDVQELRLRTGAGMMDCRNALTAANGDINLAIENLRKSGIAKAEKSMTSSTTPPAAPSCRSRSRGRPSRTR